jgi:hypothetical protein
MRREYLRGRVIHLEYFNKCGDAAELSFRQEGRMYTAHSTKTFKMRKYIWKFYKIHLPDVLILRSFQNVTQMYSLYKKEINGMMLNE